MTEKVRVSALYIHPVKSAGSIAVDSIELDELGAVNDRRWMLVDVNGAFLTQRELGALALIHPALHEDGLVLRSPSREELFVEAPPIEFPVYDSIVWGDPVRIRDAGDAAAAWCSAIVGMSVRLTHIAESSRRPLQTRYAGSVNSKGRTVALSDGAPLLILGEGSLAALNVRLAEKRLSPLGVDRFRPNVVLSGTHAHDEDEWQTIRIGNLTLGVGTPCPRCVMTTVDQSIGKRSPVREGEAGGEPLRTLATYRRQGTGVMFGMNATNAASGTLRVGDAVTIVERKAQSA
ncbi:MAG: MOSC N-terminal beta barrel domain-containing protein [Gemmatimonadaceae bacterium]